MSRYGLVIVFLMACGGASDEPKGSVGQDGPCEEGHVCLSWWKPGEGPPGLADLGICAWPTGWCENKAGRECAVWNPLQ